MKDKEAKELARFLIVQSANDVEPLDIVEHLADDVSDDDLAQVADLIATAEVSVSRND